VLFGITAVLNFVLLHLADNSAAAVVVFGQAHEMPGQMVGDLSLGFCQKAQTDAVSSQAGGCANGE
jgi:hypothetical protein